MTDDCDNMENITDSKVTVMFTHFDGLGTQMWKTEQITLKDN